MKTVIFKVFMRKYLLKKDTMNKSGLQRVYKQKTCPRDSKIITEKRIR